MSRLTMAATPADQAPAQFTTVWQEISPKFVLRLGFRY